MELAIGNLPYGSIVDMLQQTRGFHKYLLEVLPNRVFHLGGTVDGEGVDCIILQKLLGTRLESLYHVGGVAPFLILPIIVVLIQELLEVFTAFHVAHYCATTNVYFSHFGIIMKIKNLFKTYRNKSLVVKFSFMKSLHFNDPL